MDNSGTNYFRVASLPPRLFQRGQKLSYAIDVLSKQGNVQYTLESVLPEQRFPRTAVSIWDVPANFSPHEAVVLVKLRDGSGQELATHHQAQQTVRTCQHRPLSTSNSR